MSSLIIIPARGGSKGIPGKNYKLLDGKPLILYTLDVARKLVPDESICVTTDSEIIAGILSEYEYKLPFIRPPHLSTDTSSSQAVMQHALNYYSRLGISYSNIVLLQPTSPFRTEKQVKEALTLYDESLDMVVSVKETKSNPYYSLFEEDENEFLKPSKENCFERRQDVPKVYEFNGAIYVINVNSLERTSMVNFKKVKKYVMDEMSSIDIDTPLDWTLAEAVLKNLHSIQDSNN